MILISDPENRRLQKPPVVGSNLQLEVFSTENTIHNREKANRVFSQVPSDSIDSKRNAASNAADNTAETEGIATGRGRATAFFMYAEEGDPHLIDTPKHSVTDVVICLNAALAGSSNHASFPTPRRKSEHPWTIELRRGH